MSRKSVSAPSTSRPSARRGRQVQPPKRQLWPWILGVVVFVAIVGVLVYSRIGSSSTGEIAGVETFANLSRDHVSTPQTYAQTPPVGGAHYAVWQNCGFYSQPVQAENAVHSLEHGAIWITYQPDLPPEALQQLQETSRLSSYILLSPWPGLTSPVVASAWGLQLKLDSAGDPRLAEFIRAYAQGPQTPEPGATCQGGTSATVAQ